MRTHIEFRSEALLHLDQAEGVLSGKAVAKIIFDGLPANGFVPVEFTPEDWGWRVSLKNPEFPLWIGCGHYQEYTDGHLCFIEPSKPEFRRWFKKVITAQTVEALAGVLETVLTSQPSVHSLRWWRKDEI